MLKLDFPAFRLATRGFSIQISADVSETVFGLLQTGNFSSGPREVVQDPGIKMRFAWSGKVWHHSVSAP